MRWLLPERQVMDECKWRLVDWPERDPEPPAYYITEHDTIVAEVYDIAKAEEIVMRLNQWEQDEFDRMRRDLISS